MRRGISPGRWQDIGWNSIFFQVPASWQPTVIYPQYLFFAHEDQPVFEIKWQELRGRFSLQSALDKISSTLGKGTKLDPWDLPADILCPLAGYTVEGLQLRHEMGTTHVLVIHCPACGRVSLLQWHLDIEASQDLFVHVAETFQDHTEKEEQVWSVYDFRILLPRAAALTDHEFVPGRYTLRFDLDHTAITLYRFKPAAVLLHGRNIGKFGMELLNFPPLEQKDREAVWEHRRQGLDRVLAKIRRQPVWQWMRLWHDPGHNVLLGVKAEGGTPLGRTMLERICANFVALDTD